MAIWFGILVLIVVGIGLTAPPIGLNVFVIHQIAKDVPLFATYRGVLPFLVADVFRLAWSWPSPALRSGWCASFLDINQISRIEFPLPATLCRTAAACP